MDQLQKREQKLYLDLQKLQEAQEQLKAEAEALAVEKQKMDEKEEELAQVESEVERKETKLATMSDLLKSAEATEHLNSILNETVQKLKAQYDETKSELDSARQRLADRIMKIEKTKEMTDRAKRDQTVLDQEEAELRQVEVEAATDDGIVNVARRKAANVGVLRHIVGQLSAEVQAREAEVQELEKLVAEKKEKISETASRRKALDKRRQTADERRRNAIAAIKERNDRRKNLLAKREEIRQKRDDAEKEQEEMDQMEIDLKKEEDEVSVLREQREKEMKEAQNRMETASRVSETPKDRAEDFMKRYQEDAAVIEKHFLRLERTAAKRKAAVELEQSKWSSLWNQKNEEADEAIADLEKRIKLMSGNTDSLKAELEEIRQVHEKLQEQINGEEDEIQTLSEGPNSQKDEIEKEHQDAMEERQKLLAQEREIEAKIRDQQRESDQLDLKKAALANQDAELDSRMHTLKLREDTARKMLELYKRQIATVDASKERCQSSNK